MKETPRFPRSVSLQDQLEIDDLHPHLVVVGLGPGKTRGFVVVFLGGEWVTSHKYTLPYWLAGSQECLEPPFHGEWIFSRMIQIQICKYKPHIYSS